MVSSLAVCGLAVEKKINFLTLTETEATPSQARGRGQTLLEEQEVSCRTSSGIMYSTNNALYKSSKMNRSQSVPWQVKIRPFKGRF